jgi:glycerol-3-phosphate acyltransferase PlsY
MLSAALIVPGSYLIGGVSAAYIAGRILRGIDLRLYGSRNVGASNVFQTVSRAAVIPVGLLDVAQGTAGILIAKAAGEDLSVQVAAGLAALAGHNWSPFLRFSGGRGVGPAIGFMLVLSWPGLGAFVGCSLVGVARGAVPQLVGLGILVAPLAALAGGQSPEIVAGLSVIPVLVFVKRLLTNEPSLPRDGSVLMNRLLYDRDTRERDPWVRGRTETD